MKRPIHQRAALQIALVILCAVSVALAADETGYVIRSYVREVRLSFSASDGEGHKITELRAADLVVVDNEMIIRKFRSLRPASEKPINLAIVVDASGSMEKTLSRMVDVVKRFVAATSWGPRDKVSIIVFGGKDSRVLCAFGCANPNGSTALTDHNASGLTPLYDALIRTTELLATETDSESRPAVMLFSDGFDNYSRHSISDAIAAAQSLDAPIYALDSRGRKSDSGGEQILNALTQSTGGFVLDTKQLTEQSLRDVIEDLRGGFVLTYQPIQSTALEHSIRILPATDPRIHFCLRRGYREETTREQ